MSEQYLSTSRLGNVMRLIALGRQTGLLRVVRGQGPTREDGEVQFIDGQIAMATVGQLSGGAAVAVLQNWGESYYHFLDGVNRLQQTATSNNLTGWGTLTNNDSLPPMGSGSYPTSYGTSQPPGSGQTNYPNGYNTNPNSTNPHFNSSGSMGGPSGSMSNPSGQFPIDSGSLPGQSRYTGPQNIPPQVLAKLANASIVLRRLTSMNPVDMPALDRRERQMLLLIDNRRTITDLVRLTRRGDDEIRAILAHLIALGLVE